MFDHGTAPGWRSPKVLGVYFLQLIISYPLTYLFAIPVDGIFSSVGLSGKDSAGILFAGYLGVICIGVGTGVGWVITRWAPSFTSTGRWIWVLPSAVVIPDLLYELLRRQQIPWLPESLFATGDNEGLGVYLFTLPTCCAVGYSIGAYFKKRTATHGLGWRAKAIAVFISALAVLTLLLHDIEYARISKWNRVRSVIDPGGLQFSAGAMDMCGSGASALSRAMLPRGTYVEIMEQRACNDGQVADRVRVLDGPKEGQDGWVLDYGLLGH